LLKKTLAILTIATTIIVTGCSNDTTSKDNNSQSPSASPPLISQKGKLALDFDTLYPNTAMKDYAKSIIGTVAPDFTLQNLKGENVSLKDFKGKNVVLILAESTCVACVNFKPTIDEFRKVHPDQIVLEAYFHEPISMVTSYLKQSNKSESDWILTGEKPNTIFEDYKKPTWIPASFFIDSQGIIQFVNFGGSPLNVFEDMTKLSF
jgi:thiol-disulfide isomerase/thioredoxin